MGFSMAVVKAVVDRRGYKARRFGDGEVGGSSIRSFEGAWASDVSTPRPAKAHCCGWSRLLVSGVTLGQAGERVVPYRAFRRPPTRPERLLPSPPPTRGWVWLVEDSQDAGVAGSIPRLLYAFRTLSVHFRLCDGRDPRLCDGARRRPPRRRHALSGRLSEHPQAPRASARSRSRRRVRVRPRPHPCRPEGEALITLAGHSVSRLEARRLRTGECL